VIGVPSLVALQILEGKRFTQTIPAVQALATCHSTLSRISHRTPHAFVLAIDHRWARFRGRLRLPRLCNVLTSRFRAGLCRPGRIDAESTILNHCTGGRRVGTCLKTSPRSALRTIRRRQIILACRTRETTPMPSFEQLRRNIRLHLDLVVDATMHGLNRKVSLILSHVAIRRA